MKNYICGIMILGITCFYACKPKTDEEVNNNTTEIPQENLLKTDSITRNDSINKVIVLPDFTDENAKNYAIKFSKYVNSLNETVENSDDSKLTELTKEAVNLEKEFNKVKENISSEEKIKLEVYINELKQSVN